MSDFAASDTDVDLTHLRPTTTLEMLDRVFEVIRKRPALFAGLTGLYLIPELVFAVQAWIAGSMEQIENFVPYYFAMKLLAQWPAAALNTAAFQTYLFPKRPLRAWSLLRATSPRVPYLILTYFIVLSLLFLVAVVVPTGLLQTLTEDALGILSVLMAAGLFVTAIYLAATWSLIAPLVIIEKKAFGEALIRSMQLMKLKFEEPFAGDGALRRLAVAVMFPGIVYGVCLLMTRLIAALAGPVSGTDPDLFFSRVQLSLWVPAEAVVTPWLITSLVMIYTECRMRREALDLQVRFLVKGDFAVPDESLGLDEE
jgi:hypothetical protein